VCSADHYFEKGGYYHFNRRELGKAHSSCLDKALSLMKASISPIVIDNTNTTHKEMEKYLHTATRYDYDIRIVRFDCPIPVSLARQVHQVPEETIRKMAERLTANPFDGEEVVTVPPLPLNVERFEVWKRVLLSPQPSTWVMAQQALSALEPELSILFQIPQDPTHHPEGDAGAHTLEVLDRARGLLSQIPEEDHLIFMLSALLHDVGKATHTFYRTEPKRLTHWMEPKPRDSRIVAYGHDLAGEEVARTFLSRLTDDPALLVRVPRMVKYHMRPLLLKDAGRKAFLRLREEGCELFLAGMLSWADKGERPDYWFRAAGLEPDMRCKNCLDDLG
jgi:hypothetical protein